MRHTFSLALLFLLACGGNRGNGYSDSVGCPHSQSIMVDGRWFTVLFDTTCHEFPADPGSCMLDRLHMVSRAQLQPDGSVELVSAGQNAHFVRGNIIHLPGEGGMPDYDGWEVNPEGRDFLFTIETTTNGEPYRVAHVVHGAR